VIVAGATIRVVDFALELALGREPFALRIVDIAASIAVVAAAVYVLVRGVSVMRRRFLWKVSRKLILSYVFIGFFPAILLLAFFLLGGVLLFFNLSAYLVRTEMRSLVARTDAMAQATASEIFGAGGRDISGVLQRHFAAAASQSPGMSFAVVPLTRSCEAHSDSAGQTMDAAQAIAVAGPWRHVEPPGRIPDWIGCDGFRGLLALSSQTDIGNQASQRALPTDRLTLATAPNDTGIVVRAVTMPARDSRYAVVADLPVSGAIANELRQAMGVELNGVSDVSRDVALLPRRLPDEAVPPGPSAPRFTSIAFLEYFDWNTGRSGTLQTSIRLSIGEMYDRISAAPGLDNTRNIVIILLELVGGLFLLIELVTFVIGLNLARSITGSVHELFSGTERVRHGDFTHKIDIKTSDQLGELAQSFNSMTASIEGLLVEAAEKKRLDEELRIAHEIQMSLLPQGPFRMPGVSITTLCVPAREIGGDYYDVMALGGGRVGVLIADVSGKGASAALYMAELKGLMLILSKTFLSPRQLLIEANGLIAEHLGPRSFITMIYAVIDTEAGTMTFARAGHTPLIHVPARCEDETKGRAANVLAPDGLVLGLKIDDAGLFERLLVEQTIPLHRGDVFLFFTDGVSEAMNAQDDYFGDERLARLLEDHADLPAEELRERVIREISAFVGDAPQHDDMTMILLKITSDAHLAPEEILVGDQIGV
jgi:serine phosphatase RsbU (regulator of sigma subunit)